MVKLVGILNITPDSFSDGGQYFEPNKAVERAKKLFNDGAVIVDVGAESTRPNAAIVSPREEWARLEKVLTVLIPIFPSKISLDSHNPATIRKAYQIGPVIINDVTGMNSSDMVDLVIELDARCIISHLPGTDIQAAHLNTPVNSIQTVVDDLLARKNLLISRGLNKDKIILDPGIGFGKTPELNWQLLKFAEYVPGQPVLIGYSRKRFLGENRMKIEPNLEAAKIAIEAGAQYLRVHDVAAHKRFLDKLKP